MGASVVTGGHRHRLGGNFYEPTVLANVPHDALIFTLDIIDGKRQRGGLPRP